MCTCMMFAHNTLLRKFLIFFGQEWDNGLQCVLPMRVSVFMCVSRHFSGKASLKSLHGQCCGDEFSCCCSCILHTMHFHQKETGTAPWTAFCTRISCAATAKTWFASVAIAQVFDSKAHAIREALCHIFGSKSPDNEIIITHCLKPDKSTPHWLADWLQ